MGKWPHRSFLLDLYFATFRKRIEQLSLQSPNPTLSVRCTALLTTERASTNCTIVLVRTHFMYVSSVDNLHPSINHTCIHIISFKRPGPYHHPFSLSLIYPPICHSERFRSFERGAVDINVQLVSLRAELDAKIGEATKLRVQNRVLWWGGCHHD